MPNKAIDALVFCPFYITEARTTITCEGLIGTQTVNRFADEEDKVYHETNFCTGKTCVGCGVYSSLMQSYIVPKKGKRAYLRH